MTNGEKENSMESHSKKGLPMNPQFYRKDTEVWVRMKHGLETCCTDYAFGRRCENQEEAELIAQHMNREVDKWRSKIAREAMIWLKPEEVSALKRKMQERWHGGKHCWK